MIEVLLELFGELLLQVLGEVLLELGWHALAEPFQRAPNPWLATLGYAAFGALAGGISLLIVSHHLTPSGLARLANLAFTPLVAGLCMAAMGAWRQRRGEMLYRIDKFAYGYVFALALALVRFQFAQ